ncbi:MAG: hypothetical protein KIPDCIKN_02467 [Haliscomenobacter sp.]|jgi:hypothetical protein|nr:hypothetical protein [Haliscomenobacter sp.]
MEKREERSASAFFFLLGGYDLEMAEIRRMLEEYQLVEGEDFLDFKLSWGARLSAYQGHFHAERINVAVELQEDIPPPARYLRIDHHNELPPRPAAIEQLAALLGIPLQRRQQLVAANDAGYIPAMRAMGASEAEISDIRRQDRASQGVTEDDERLAEKAIQETMYVDRGVAVIPAFSSKFSPITDRLFGRFEKILIFTDRELTYYGKNKPLLESRFADWMRSGMAYSGGGEEGFWGVAANGLSEEEILQLVTQIPVIV